MIRVVFQNSRGKKNYSGKDLGTFGPKSPLGCDSFQTLFVFDDIGNFEEYWLDI